MKKVFAIAFAGAVIAGFASCGSSDADKKADSANAVQTKKEMDETGDHMIDSMNRANAVMDSTNKAGAKTDTAKSAGK
ncbi:MAG TPA: hypothetical protein VFU15_01210 [Bacteroidia bacterium]|nr:hypothetical protein [Bacteroidia bacterium]